MILEKIGSVEMKLERRESDYKLKSDKKMEEIRVNLGKGSAAGSRVLKMGFFNFWSEIRF